jgi:steroid delta-isomerase-like uncharacterized protein
LNQLKQITRFPVFESPPQEDLMSDHKKMVVRHLMDEFWNKKNFNIAEELCAPDMVYHNDGVPLHTAEVVALFTQVCSAFPDITVTVDDLLAENDKVALRWSSEGTHKGELNGIPPTNRRVTTTGIAIYRFDEGRIVEAWNNSDSLGMLRQLGVAP